ncbi:hypothetical protein DICPUDRAFT_160244 [Dictyostelium purpureum]|uniref:RING-type domain-containing protein n=1 Tax=Dictyostelium purpureum TaxID=5786 RepID=F1A5Z8_DICPU|nr:uncharacterized protein DICPUDRAFT_160244 [Dictyostelium purpureum]EGC28383.1 hypothetical protein DICPUDRAFT_160244 [Dictyostelium purpureum]|eukprot:XP_003295092.1 hypothetical protein DICPUDRAFT_160244 [Dictyostelium purpureum]
MDYIMIVFYILLAIISISLLYFIIKYFAKKYNNNRNNNSNNNTPITNNLFDQMNFYQHPQQHPQYFRTNDQSPSHLFGLTTFPSHLRPQFPPPNSSAPSTILSSTSEGKEWIFGSKYLEIIKKREKEEKEEKEWEEYQKSIKDRLIREGFCYKCISADIKPHRLAFIGCGHQFCYKCILKRSFSDKTCPLCEDPFDDIIVNELY